MALVRIYNAGLSPVDNGHRFKLDALWCWQPVKTGNSVGDVIRAPKTSDRPSCDVKNGLETTEQAGGKASQPKGTSVDYWPVTAK